VKDLKEVGSSVGKARGAHLAPSKKLPLSRSLLERTRPVNITKASSLADFMLLDRPTVMKPTAQLPATKEGGPTVNSASWLASSTELEVRS